MRREIAIAAGSRYIGANEEIKRQFFFFVSFRSIFAEAHVFSFSIWFGGDFGSARCCSYHGGGQGDQTQVATS